MIYSDRTISDVDVAKMAVGLAGTSVCRHSALWAAAFELADSGIMQATFRGPVQSTNDRERSIFWVSNSCFRQRGI